MYILLHRYIYTSNVLLNIKKLLFYLTSPCRMIMFCYMFCYFNNSFHVIISVCVPQRTVFKYIIVSIFSTKLLVKVAKVKLVFWNFNTTFLISQEGHLGNLIRNYVNDLLALFVMNNIHDSRKKIKSTLRFLIDPLTIWLL